MTTEDLHLLERAVDYVVALELVSGEQFFAEVILVADQPPTPDVFIHRMNREKDGAFTPANEHGESILLEQIARVAPLPWVVYPDEPA
jgi:hypothetical protein